MTKRIIHILLSCWLAVILLFGSTPKDFVHLLSGHKDTVHKHEQANYPVAENQHHHCSFLGFELMPFANDIQLPVFYTSATEYGQYKAVVKGFTFQQKTIIALLRGPPAA